MNVKQFLELCGERSVLTIMPEGRQTIDLVSKYVDALPDSMTLTGNLLLQQISCLDSAVQENILKTELNDGMDVLQYRNELRSLLEEKDVWGKRIRLILSVGMATLLAGMCIAHTAAMAWVAYQKQTLPDWEVLLIVYGIPGMVVWHFFGVMTQERRDFLAAAIGRTPQSGIIGGLLSNMGSGIKRRSYDSQGFPDSGNNNYGGRSGGYSQRNDPPGGPPTV